MRKVHFTIIAFHFEKVFRVCDFSSYEPKYKGSKSESTKDQPCCHAFARWEKVCQTLEDIQESLDFGAKAFVLNPQPREEADTWNPVTALDVEDLDSPPVLSEDLRKALQWLIGTSNSINDSHRYVPQALWQVTEYCEGVIVLHADRDTDCIALYAKEEFDWSQKLSELTANAQSQSFWISCPVPTMTLRWKRALYEACDNWDGDCPEELRLLVPIQEEESVEEVDPVDSEVFIEEIETAESESKEDSIEGND